MVKFIEVDTNGKCLGVFEQPEKLSSFITIAKDTPVSVGDLALEVLRADKLSQVRKDFQAKIDAITAKYAPYELESFADQRAEWRAWKANSAAATPVVDALAAARGLTTAALMAKIEANVLAITTMQGQQNAIESQIKAATTVAALEAITW